MKQLCTMTSQQVSSLRTRNWHPSFVPTALLQPNTLEVLCRVTKLFPRECSRLSPHPLTPNTHPGWLIPMVILLVTPLEFFVFGGPCPLVPGWCGVEDTCCPSLDGQAGPRLEPGRRFAPGRSPSW